jgi:PAS domain S-box-containing protein
MTPLPDADPLLDAERYRLLFENVPVGILHFDARGAVTAVNAAMMEMIGVSREAMMGLPLGRVIGAPGDRIAALVEETLRGRTPRYDGPWVTSSRTVEVSVVLSPLHGPAGEVLGGMAMVADLAGRMATVAAGVAHEINNPLSWVMLGLELIERELAGAEPDLARLRACCKDAIEGAERVRNIVGDLRAVSRSGEEQAAPEHAGRRARLLLIDDEPNLGVTLATGLRERSDLVSVRSGAEAIRLLLQDQAFDLILCDLMMPGLTGMDVFEQVIRDRPGLRARFVFTTGGAVTERARRFLESVPDQRLDKPFRLEQVESLLARIGA